MNEQLLNKLEYIIFEDEIFKETIKASSENKERVITQLLQERGLSLTYPQFQSEIKKLFKELALKKKNKLDDELSDDDLDKISGGYGVESKGNSCFEACLASLGNPPECRGLCL